MRAQLLILLSFNLLAATSTQALELILKNGDRLNGKLVQQTESHLVIEHPHLGEMEIAISALQTLPDALQDTPTTSDVSPDPVTDPAAVPVPDPTADPETDPPPPSPETPSPEKPTPDEPGPEESVKDPQDPDNSGFLLPQKLVRLLVKMNAEIGLAYDIQKSRKDREDVRFYLNSQWRNGRSSFRLDADYEFGEVDDEISEDRFQADFRFRRNKPGNLLIQSRTRYKTDGVRKINHFVEHNLGLGWQWVESQRMKLTAGPEIAINFRDLDTSNRDLGGWSYLGSFFQDSEFQISDVYQLDQEARAYVDPEDRENWGYALEMVLTGKITKDFSLQLGYEFNYDNQVPRTVPQEEINFFSSLMYTF